MITYALVAAFFAFVLFLFVYFGIETPGGGTRHPGGLG